MPDTERLQGLSTGTVKCLGATASGNLPSHIGSAPAAGGFIHSLSADRRNLPSTLFFQPSHPNDSRIHDASAYSPLSWKCLPPCGYFLSRCEIQEEAGRKMRHHILPSSLSYLPSRPPPLKQTNCLMMIVLHCVLFDRKQSP